MKRAALRRADAYAGVRYGVRWYLRKHASVPARDVYNALSRCTYVDTEEGHAISLNAIVRLVEDYSGSVRRKQIIQGALGDLEALGLLEISRDQGGRISRVRLEKIHISKREGGREIPTTETGRENPTDQSGGEIPTDQSRQRGVVGKSLPLTGREIPTAPVAKSLPLFNKNPFRTPSGTHRLLKGFPVSSSNAGARASAQGPLAPASRGELEGGEEGEGRPRLITPGEAEAEHVLSTFSRLKLARGDASLSAQAREERRRELLAQCEALKAKEENDGDS